MAGSTRTRCPSERAGWPLPSRERMVSDSVRGHCDYHEPVRLRAGTVGGARVWPDRRGLLCLLDLRDESPGSPSCGGGHCRHAVRQCRGAEILVHGGLPWNGGGLRRWQWSAHCCGGTNRAPHTCSPAACSIWSAPCWLRSCSTCPGTRHWQLSRPDDPNVPAVWAAYVTSWTTWNHVRTAAALAAAASFSIALAFDLEVMLQELG